MFTGILRDQHGDKLTVINSKGRKLLVSTAATSIVDGNTATVATGQYSLQRFGLTDYVSFKAIPAFPITITYTAGYGDDPTDVPANVRAIMLAHFSFVYDTRGVGADAEPIALDRIYRQYRSFVG